MAWSRVQAVDMEWVPNPQQELAMDIQIISTYIDTDLVNILSEKQTAKECLKYMKFKEKYTLNFL